MDEIKFEESMQAARLTQTNRATQIETSPTLQGQTDPTPTRMHDKEKDTSGNPRTAKKPHLFFQGRLKNIYLLFIICFQRRYTILH